MCIPFSLVKNSSCMRESFLLKAMNFSRSVTVGYIGFSSSCSPGGGLMQKPVKSIWNHL